MKIALLIDIDNAKISLPVFNDILQQLRVKGNLIYTKVYGFNERKHIKFDEIIEKYGFDSVPTMRYKKRAKSQLDSRIIIDAIKMFHTMPHIDTYCLVTGDGDLVPLLSYLKSGGKRLLTLKTDVIDGNDHMFDDKITLSIAYNKPVKLSKKQLNAKLKALSEKTTKIMESMDDDADRKRDALIAEIEDLLASKGDGLDEDEISLYDSLESLLDIIR